MKNTSITDLKRWLIVTAYLVFTSAILSAQSVEDQLIGSWYFAPQYALPEKAANIPGQYEKSPKTHYSTVDVSSYPFIFYGEEPGERKRNFIPSDSLPKDAFSVEMWLLDHVNQPVGVLATLKDRHVKQDPDWLIGYYNKDIIFSLSTKDSPMGTILHAKSQQPWKRYWHHLVATYDGKRMQLFLNAELVASTPVGARTGERLQSPEIELAAYMRHEPHMRMGNLLRELKIYGCDLDIQQVSERFKKLQQQAEAGIIYPERFHFNAGPYLHYATPYSINLLWETDREAYGRVEFGTQIPLQQSIELNELKKIQEVTLQSLEAGKSYFYRVSATDKSGNEIKSGMLSFQTAVSEEASFSFALMGDTEARPHINDRISKLVWDERPNFVLNLGDLTDGGFEPHKFEWNYEYFAGTRQLHSRVPVFPVAGNGEGDLHWYRKYHKLPGDESFYSFRYGNAAFFMLNSNERETEFVPGGRQYEWLEEKLKNCSATWKFVAHHHAPYSADEDDYGNSWEGASTYGDPGMRPMVPLYEKYGVDMVFFGHLHTYQRTLPIQENRVRNRKGVIYIQCGGSGGNLEDFAPTRAWFSAKTYRGHHYATITINQNQLRLQVTDEQGRMKDLINVEKE